MSVNISPRNLLAKSVKRDADGRLKPGCLLTTHTADVVEAARTILDLMGESLRQFFKLPVESMPVLRATVLLAALWHDIGKANNGFQKSVRKRGVQLQLIRHEHLSVLLMSLPEVREWLRIKDADFEIARVAVLGHHLKTASERNQDQRFISFAQQLKRDLDTEGDPDTIHVYPEHKHFKQLLNNVRAEFELREPTFQIPQKWSFAQDTASEHIGKHKHRVIKEMGTFCTNLRQSTEDGDDSRTRLLMGVKVVLIAADAAGSGLRREGHTVTEWIKDKLGKGETAATMQELLDKKVARIEALKHARGDTDYKFDFNDLQKKADSLGNRALLLSACGSGKTLFAYKWIKEQLTSRPGWRAMFLYPTTGTAKQGFKDYAALDDDAALVSSRAEFDLEGMFENPDELSAHLADEKLYALGYWAHSNFSATVDAFLGFLQNNYSSLSLLPLLSRSVIVIDEVHSFDSAMFSGLFEFLKTFDVPVLMMTASLQKGRLERIRREFPEVEVYPRELSDLPDLKNAVEFPRYKVQYIKEEWWSADNLLCPTELLEVVRKAYAAKLKVLWVVNTVDRCIKIARKLQAQSAYCYHSRFEYKNRVGVHDNVVAAFQPENLTGAIAVTTQVCEMSLDLDADVLITELAPASSLIQRMGRCNRLTKGRDAEEHGQVYIYRPPKDAIKPYLSEFFDTGKELLAQFDLPCLITQESLAKKLDKVTSQMERNKACKFTEPMWTAISENDFRDTEEYTVTAVRESQLEEFRRLRKARKSVAGILLQAPVSYVEPEKREGIWARVVPDVTRSNLYEYCEWYGLRKKERIDG